MSSICSVPIESRMVEGVMCCSASSSGLICECVVVYGCMTRLLTSATLASSEKICRESMNFHASSCPPLISKVKIPSHLMSKSELYFIIAEVKARLGQVFSCTHIITSKAYEVRAVGQ